MRHRPRPPGRGRRQLRHLGARAADDDIDATDPLGFSNSVTIIVVDALPFPRVFSPALRWLAGSRWLSLAPSHPRCGPSQRLPSLASVAPKPGGCGGDLTHTLDERPLGGSILAGLLAHHGSRWLRAIIEIGRAIVLADGRKTKCAIPVETPCAVGGDRYHHDPHAGILRRRSPVTWGYEWGTGEGVSRPGPGASADMLFAQR
jgi:hypothetical protein